MTTRAKLIEKINSIENEDHLDALLRYLEASDKYPVELNNKDIEAIEISEDQFKRGEYLSHDTLRKKVNKWLEK